MDEQLVFLPILANFASLNKNKESLMEKMTEKDKKKQADASVETKTETQAKEPKKKVSKTWEAIQKWKGSVIINDPTLLL